MKKNFLQTQNLSNNYNDKTIQHHDIKYQTYSYFKDYQNQKKIENLIWISCLSFVGLLWVWIIALYWLISFKEKERLFMISWKENKSFRTIFPYQPEFHSLIAEDIIYQRKLQRNNEIKTIFIAALAIPLIGYIILLVLTLLFSVYTLGIGPFLIYYYLNNPNRYISYQIEKMYQEMPYKSKIKEYLTHYNRSGNLSFNFVITKKILRAIIFAENESILGIFRSFNPLNRSFLIITDQKVIKYNPALIFGYGESIDTISKDKISNYRFTKAIFLHKLTITLSDRPPLVFSNLKKHSIMPLRSTLNKLEQINVRTSMKTPIVYEQKEIKIQKVSEPFFCQVCESKRPATSTRLKCDNCSRFVCNDCFNQMIQVGKRNCPMCDGLLIS